MKKIITVTLCIVLVLLFAGCGKNGDTSKVEIDYGASSIYSKEEIDSAIEIIKKQFALFEGCELHRLSYMTDEECNNADNIEWMNDLRTDDNKEAFTQCIAFESSFCSLKKGGGTWEANEEYTWSWWLARSEGGEWNLIRLFQGHRICSYLPAMKINVLQANTFLYVLRRESFGGFTV